MPLNLLILEDRPHDAELMLRELRRAGYEIKWKRVETKAEFDSALDEPPDLILSDYSLPGFSVMQALALLKERRLNVPFIVLTAALGDEAAVECIKLGATDYLLKDRLARLPEAVRRALDTKRRQEQQDRVERSLQESERIRDAIIKAALDCIVTIDQEGKIVDFNPAAERTFGIERAAILGKLMVEHLIPARFRDAHNRGFARLLATGEGRVLGKRLELAALRADGTEFPVELTITATGSWDAPLFTGHIRDITAQVLAQQALRESEERFRTFMQHLPGRASIKDLDGRYTYVNDAWQEAFGLQRSSVLGRTPAEVYSPERAAALIATHRRVLETNAPLSRTFKSGSEGNDQWWLAHHFPIPDERGKTVLVGTIALDITEQKNQEEKLARLSRIHEVSSSINSAIIHIKDRQELLQEACRIAVEHGGFGIAWIGRLEPDTLDLMPVACAGIEAESFLAHSRNTARADTALGGGAAGRAVREKRAVYSNDLLTERSQGGERRKEAVRRGYRSVITLPLLLKDAAVGNLSLFAKEPNFFNEEEVKPLIELAANISFALEHIADQQNLEKLSRIRSVSSEINAAIVRVRERDALLREACRIATDHGKFELVWVASINQDKQEIVPVAWSGFTAETAHALTWSAISDPRVTLNEAMRTRHPAVRNDIEAESAAGPLRQEALQKGCRSTVCLPIVADDVVVAAIILFAAERGFFDEDELALLIGVSGNISLALEHAAREEKVLRLRRIQAVMGGISNLIVRARDRHELYSEACRIAVDEGHFGMAWIGTLDPETLDVTPAGWAGLDAANFLGKSSARMDHPLGQGVVGQAIRQRKPAFENNIVPSPGARGERRREAIRRGYRSRIALPLLVEGEVTGTIVLFAKEANFFDEAELKLLTTLAGDISFALENIGKEEKLNYLAYYDALTGLPNRQLFIDRVGQQLHSRDGDPRMVALILFDIERFRNVNESLGRRGGDELLKMISQRLIHRFRGKDYLAHLGADTFGVVIRGVRDVAEIAHAIENEILDCVREPFAVDGREIRVAAKAGVAIFPADGRDADALFKNAEAALKRTKGSGERYLFYAADMNARAAQVLSLETRLRTAVDAHQFVLHYQPKINLGTGAICGLEALIRWQDPESGLVAPGTFIPLLEETGLILEVGYWVLARALADHREWTQRGCTVPRIAVNVSTIQLQQGNFTEMITNAVQQEGANPEALELEITESLLMKDVQASIGKLSILRGLGIHIAMDDFGTGYSSLSYIARLPINSVKIDRSFISGMAASPQDMSIVTTIITLAHSLNLQVVAEGVETTEQMTMLKLLKCDEAQGYLFSKPVPGAEIEALLRRK